MYSQKMMMKKIIAFQAPSGAQLVRMSMQIEIS